EDGIRDRNVTGVQTCALPISIRPGPRPICQATKLLDADPLVRRICEQDLLIMGLSARDYLAEQRAAARPELRDAIDRLWQKIQRSEERRVGKECRAGGRQGQE